MKDIKQLNNIELWKYIFTENQLTNTEKSVMMAIALHRNNLSMLCCPSISTISKESACCIKTITSTINSLVEKNELIKINHPYHSNQYFFEYDFEYAKLLYKNPDSTFRKFHQDQAEIFCNYFDLDFDDD